MKTLWILLLLAASSIAYANEDGQFAWGVFAAGVTVSGDQPWQEQFRACREHHQGHCQIDIPDPYCHDRECSVIAIEWTVKYLLSQEGYNYDELDYAKNVQCTGTSNGRAKCFTRLPINAPFQHMHRRDSGLMMPGHALLSPSLSETREAYGLRHWFLPYPDPVVFYTYFNEGGKEYGLNYLKHGRNPPGLEGKLESVFAGKPETADAVTNTRSLQPILQPALQGQKLGEPIEQALQQVQAQAQAL